MMIRAIVLAVLCLPISFELAWAQCRPGDLCPSSRVPSLPISTMENSGPSGGGFNYYNIPDTPGMQTPRVPPSQAPRLPPSQAFAAMCLVPNVGSCEVLFPGPAMSGMGCTCLDGYGQIYYGYVP